MNRVIRKSSAQSSSEVLDLLGALFAAELIHPSKTLWLISPWITDVDVVDNSVGAFSALTRFGRRPIRLTEVLAALAAEGAQIVVATTTDNRNDTFTRRLRQLARDLNVEDKIRIEADATGRLHTKSITGDDYALAGSMNITRHGIHLREEQVELKTDSEYVAQARTDVYGRFGGEL
ncbi:phospholipase D-like domain-containing protein DpdK [Allonocardiopsis opalescens]|uniref:Phospholipase D-like protein n=1 Tax=Allonocardiopsis opalescens TaxID=1144618 RepID=A0A2T0Q2W2_9ACTN|nr:phospholipase D-like domain-containing protein DpdK [Allonocardiopsis opalescens]PRX98008.1 phospholipase D-like protein [Allonocardiopsis opalescens]